MQHQVQNAYADLTSFAQTVHTQQQYQTTQPPQPQQQFRMAPTPQHQPQQFQPQQPVQPQQEQTYGPPGNAVSSRTTKPSKVASRYGDDFVSSSSHPELGQQYRKAANIM